MPTVRALWAMCKNRWSRFTSVAVLLLVGYLATLGLIYLYRMYTPQ